jgi:hypothetical protein
VGFKSHLSDGPFLIDILVVCSVSCHFSGVAAPSDHSLALPATAAAVASASTPASSAAALRCENSDETIRPTFGPSFSAHPPTPQFSTHLIVCP